MGKERNLTEGIPGDWEVLDALMAHVAVLDPAGCIVAVNTAWSRFAAENEGDPDLTGVGVNYLEVCRDSGGRPLPELCEFLPKLLDLLAGRVEKMVFEYPCNAPCGIKRWFLLQGVARPGKNGAILTHIDITGTRVEESVAILHEREKQRLGRQLHENLCQYLVGTSLLGNALYEDLSRLGLKQAEDARQIASLMKEAVMEVRTLAKGLSAAPVEEGEGLVAALEELADQARGAGAMKCILRMPRKGTQVERSIAVPLYRIAQEAVHNVIRHAEARQLEIRLANTRNAVVLTIKDDGISYAEQGDDDSRLGLNLMDYRSRSIGAQLEVRKLAKRGTAVICTIPKPFRAPFKKRKGSGRP